MSWWFPALTTALLGTLGVMAYLAQGFHAEVLLPPLALVGAAWWYAWLNRRNR